jgi:uncharacterized protein
MPAAGMQYLHGIEILNIDDGIRPIQTVKSAVIGIIGTAPDADPSVFPINEPVLLIGDQRKAALLGLLGTLPRAVKDVFSIVGATVVIVRVEQGIADNGVTGEAAANQVKARTWSNMVGDPALKTGVWAFMTSTHKVKVKPRILVAPGFTGDRPSTGIKSITINTGGGTYVTTPTVVITGDGQGATGVARLVNGSVEAVVITNPGVGYTQATVSFTGGNLSGGNVAATASAVFGKAANPVAKALEAVAHRVRAHALLEGPNTTNEEAVDFRQDFGTRRTMILDPHALVWDRQLNDYVPRPSSAIAAGLQAYQDYNRGFWWPFSNVAIPNVGGISRPISWEIDDPDTDANYLNENEVTPIIRVDSIGEGGWRFWGLRTCDNDPMWAFWNVSRTTDMIFESITNAMLWIMDRPIRPEVIEQGVETVNFYLRSLERRGATLGGKAWIDKQMNTRDQLMAGKLRIEFDYEPPAPIERLTFGARRNSVYYDVLIDQVIKDLSSTRL